MSALAQLCLPVSVIGGAVWLWMARRPLPGDVTYVLTSYYVIHAYLREVGIYINNLEIVFDDVSFQYGDDGARAIALESPSWISMSKERSLLGQTQGRIIIGRQ